LSTFVFVAGGWHGGWCWKRVADPLRSLGHEVFTPTLTGLGERVHLLSPQVNLDTHIADIAGVLQWEDLRDVILVGHSYGGMVVTALAAQVPDRIERLVYLDALWPENGESVGDIVGKEAAQVVIDAQVDPARPPRIQGAADLAMMLGVSDRDDIEWVASRLTPQPPATLTQAIGLQNMSCAPVLFVRCTRTVFDGPDLSYARAQARAARDPSVRLVSLDAPHNAMVTHPAEVVALLEDWAPNQPVSWLPV
jgi:pimeloyl-ACP methyl ester carboxylesterase